MEFKQITPFLSVSAQLGIGDIGIAAAHGFKSIVNNRPDGESDDQPEAAALEQAAIANGLAYRHVPVVSGKVTDDDVEAFAEAMGELRGPVLAFSRTGTRSSTLWALSEAWHLEPDAILAATAAAGYDLSGLLPRLEVRARTGALAEATMESRDMLPKSRAAQHDVVIVGGGGGGISVASGLLKRRPELDVAIIEPRELHYYQPGWTLVGAACSTAPRPNAGWPTSCPRACTGSVRPRPRSSRTATRWSWKMVSGSATGCWSPPRGSSWTGTASKA